MALSDREYEKMLGEDPGNSIFAEFADILRARYDYSRALRVCLSGLSSNPACAMGRLVLARLFYEQTYTPFAVRELIELKNKFPDNQSLEALLSKIAPQEVLDTEKVLHPSEEVEADGVVAEAEFDIDDIELIESEDAKEQ